MSKSTLDNPDPDKYYYEVKGALDDFESALHDRMWSDYDKGYSTWTPEGYKEVPDGGNLATYQQARDGFKDNLSGWASQVREDLDGRIAEYHTQNLTNIDIAREGLLAAMRMLGGGTHAPGDLGSLPKLVSLINNRCGAAEDYLAWTGASAENLNHNFGIYVQSTMDNQGNIAGRLVNLYTGRSNIVEYVRHNVLHYLRSATKALTDVTSKGLSDETSLAVDMTALVTGFVTGPIGLAADVAITVGEYLGAKDPMTVPVNEIEDVVVTLQNHLDDLKQTVQSREETWTGKVQNVQGEIAGIGTNAHLELYDFTGNGTPSDKSGAPTGGFGADPDSIEKLAELCFKAATQYEGVITRVTETDAADNDLMGMNYVVTTGDIETKDTRDALLGFLKTTRARYHEVGVRLTETAKVYWGVEFDNETVLAGLRDRVEGLAPTNRDDIEDTGAETPYTTQPGVPNEPYVGPLDEGCQPGDALQGQPQYDGDPVAPFLPPPPDPNDRDGDGLPDTIDIDGGDGTGKPRV